MFPNNSLKSISPDVRVMQAFPNINLGGKPQQIVEDKEGKHPRSRFTSHYGFFITAAPPKLSKIHFSGHLPGLSAVASSMAPSARKVAISAWVRPWMPVIVSRS